MPELPEVETVVRSLRPLLAGQRIKGLLCYWPRALAATEDSLSFKALHKKLQGTEISSLERRGKFLILNIKNAPKAPRQKRAAQSSILIHLRMTGKLYLLPQVPQDKKHLSAAFLLSNKHYLIFEDQRRFGRIYYCADEDQKEKYLAPLGPEPLSADFTKDWLQDNLSLRSRQIKPLLLDQTFIAGLGNIYVDESLWEAQIHPQTPAKSLKKKFVLRLHTAIRKILKKAIQANGTSFMDFRFLGGQKGGYTEQLLVFRRTKQKCLRCKEKIVRIIVAQRSSHICPACQILIPASSSFPYQEQS